MIQKSLPRSRPIIVMGLAFGDEAKGATIASIAHDRKAELVVRFNGGSQAAHHVVDDESRVHCFSQFGAGTRSGARTHLSKYVVVDPLGLRLEADALHTRFQMKDPLQLVHVDDAAILTTPFHRLLGRAREMARNRHGSCGKGIGIAWLDRKNGKQGVTWGHIRQENLRRVLSQIRDEKLEEVQSLFEFLDDDHRMVLDALRGQEYLDDIISRYLWVARQVSPSLEVPDDPSKVLFEGAQGALLDADAGFFPYVTPSYTGARNALEICRDWGLENPFCLGVLRAYSSRHGHGPFVAEDRGLSHYLPEEHNEEGPWQGPMRVGWFDAVAARYGIRVAGQVDGLMISHLDRLEGYPQIGAVEAWEVSMVPPNLPSTYHGPQVLTDLPLLTGTLLQRTQWSAWVAEAQAKIKVMPGWAGREDRHLQDFLLWIESQLATPIVGGAFGPKTSDRVWV